MQIRSQYRCRKHGVKQRCDCRKGRVTAEADSYLVNWSTRPLLTCGEPRDVLERRAGDVLERADCFFPVNDVSLLSTCNSVSQNHAEKHLSIESRFKRHWQMFNCGDIDTGCPSFLMIMCPVCFVPECSPISGRSEVCLQPARRSLSRLSS